MSALYFGLIEIVNKVVFLLFIGFIVTVVESRTTSIIKTLDGPVQGEILKTIENGINYSSFKGIPYAEPPTGQRRFKPPIKKMPWTKVLNAVKEGNRCIQLDPATKNFTGGEDCLYLNIYTPRVMFNDDNMYMKPVMFWIHGGAFLFGSGDSSQLGPDYLLEEDVVIVTFNYRLGPLGFLNLEHENATGNAGLKDQNLALKWVKNNIAKFGGNPNHITISGESAGGASVDYHVLSDMSKGLFAQSISMSGSPLCPWGFQKPKEAVEKAFELGRKLGIHTKDKDVLLQKLLTTSALNIAIKFSEMFSPLLVFKPTIENPEIAKSEEKFISECPVDKYKSGSFFHGPHMVGFMDQETVPAAKALSELLQNINDTANKIKSYIPETPLNIPRYVWSELTAVIRVIADAVARIIINLTTDYIYKVGIDGKQQLMSKMNQNPIYYYNIAFYSEDYSTHTAQLNNTFKGAGHADDLTYLFRIDEINLKLPSDPQHPVNIVRKRMLRMWTNFAKFGNPTPALNDPLVGISWPDSTLSGEHLEIDNELSVGPRPTDAFSKVLQLFPGIYGC